MFIFIYSILYFLIILPIFLFTLLKKKNNKPYIGKRWLELFGISQARIPKGLIWIHSVSVGESNLSIRLIKGVFWVLPLEICLWNDYSEKCLRGGTFCLTGAFYYLNPHLTNHFFLSL